MIQSLQRYLWADKKWIGDGTALLGRMNHKPIMEVNVMELFIKPGRPFGFMYQDERIPDGHLVVEDGIWINSVRRNNEKRTCKRAGIRYVCSHGNNSSTALGGVCRKWTNH